MYHLLNLTLLYLPYINNEIWKNRFGQKRNWPIFFQLKSYNMYIHVIFKLLDLDQMKIR